MYKLRFGFFIFILFTLVSCKVTEHKKVCLKNGGACVIAEIPDDASKRQLGLMFRKGIAFSEGMLFIFEEEARHAFWMKNMKFSIDIIWLSKDKRVVDIASNVLPCVQDCPRLVPKQDAKYVLETAAGFCAKYNIRPGDQLCW